MSREQAEAQLKRCKAYFPFRKWFAAEIGGEWQCFDSMRKLKNALRKAGIQSAEVMAAQ